MQQQGALTTDSNGQTRKQTNSHKWRIHTIPWQEASEDNVGRMYNIGDRVISMDLFTTLFKSSGHKPDLDAKFWTQVDEVADTFGSFRQT